MALRRKAANLFGAAALTVQDALFTQFKRLDLGTTTDAAALMLLLQSKALPIGALATLLALDHSSAVRATDRLVERQLVARGPDPEDARRVVLALTPAGVIRARQVLDVRRQVLGKMLDSLRPRDIEALCNLLAAVLANQTTGRRFADRVCRLCDEESCGGDYCPVERAACLRQSGAASVPK